MNRHAKTVVALNKEDLQSWPVWRFVNADAIGETAVIPVKHTPVGNLSGKIVGAPVRLANGKEVLALIGNVDTGNARLTEHFLTLSIERDGRWFSMARYHDADYTDRGPAALAAFLGLPIDAVFPISYDITSYAQGELASLRGTIPKEPREKLTRAQIIALAVP